MNKLILLIICILTLCQGNLWASNERQDLRYEHAIIAYSEHNYKKALAILEQNLTPDWFHAESYILLGDVFIKLNYPQKALKTYYYIIKKAHSKEIVKLVGQQDIIKHLGTLDTPNQKTLEAYLKVAIIWYQLYSKMKFPKDYQLNLRRQAQKYFFICSWYKYNPRLTSYYQALIDRDQHNFLEAYEKFKNYKKISTKNPYADPEEEGNIDFLIADTLRKAGRHNKASIYLRSLTEDHSKSSSLREYANTYLESMHLESWSFSASLMGIYDSNIHNLTSEQKENFDELEETHIQKHSFLWRKNLNFFYSSKRYGHYSYTFTIQGKEDLNTEKGLAQYDTRDLLTSFELTRDSFKLSYLKFKYQYYKKFTKQDSNSGFLGNETKHSFIPKYVIQLNGKHSMGQLIWSLPISLINNADTGQNTSELGISLNYRSLEISKYFSPIYAFTLKTVGESEEFDNSTQFQLSVTNLFSNFKQTSLLLTFDYLKNMNSEESLSYTAINLDFTVSRNIERIKNLYVDGSIIRTISDEDAENTYSKWKMYLGLSYSI